MKHKVLFTADLHGNEVQYSNLVDYAVRTAPRTIIIGGDITPKTFPDSLFIKGQRMFLMENLRQLLRPLENLPDTRLFLIMGNDDCAANMDVLRQAEDLYQVIHGKRLSLTDDFDIVGYSYVPITPFGIKDWEKFDFSQPPQDLWFKYQMRKVRSQLKGVKSTQNGWSRYVFTPAIEESDSIQKDLSQEIFRKNPEKTVYVMHAPPDGTALDQIRGGLHVGSMAVRTFIEEAQPYLTLHGHIHETVAVSGRFKQAIGRTPAMTAGNGGVGPQMAALEFDLYEPWDAKRIVL